jgi:hypothetical protein
VAPSCALTLLPRAAREAVVFLHTTAQGRGGLFLWRSPMIATLLVSHERDRRAAEPDCLEMLTTIRRMDI